MKTRLWAIMLVVLCTLLTSAAQILFKIGANQINLNALLSIINLPLMGGIILYGLGAVLIIIALKGGEVTVLYPIITSSYVWVTLGSSYFFGEEIPVIRWIGIGLIVIGILMITFDGHKNGEKNKLENDNNNKNNKVEVRGISS